MDKVICVSNDCKKAFLYRFPDLKDKVNVIYNAIDKNTITKNPMSFLLQTKLLPLSPFVVLPNKKV